MGPAPACMKHSHRGVLLLSCQSQLVGIMYIHGATAGGTTNAHLPAAPAPGAPGAGLSGPGPLPGALMRG